MALHLPTLALEAFVAALPLQARGRPVALLEAGRVAAVAESAAVLGVRPGLARATALALVPSLCLGLADPVRDAQAQRAVAHAALRFTPSVAFAGRDTVLLEVASTLRLWGGSERLLERLREDLIPLGHRVMIAWAPTPLGAALLALAGATPATAVPGDHAAFTLVDRTDDLTVLQGRLDDLALPVLCRLKAAMDDPGSAPRPRRPTAGRRAASASTGSDLTALLALETFQALGLRTVGDLRALPRPGLARRLGPGWLALLDRARGLVPDLHDPVRLPDRFETQLALWTRADRGEQVWEGVKPMLTQLLAWARARQGRVERLALSMRHEPRHRQDEDTPEATTLVLALAEPSDDPVHLGRLLRERLARQTLPAPTLELVLRCDSLAAGPTPPADLFPMAGAGPGDLARLLEHLQARLGAQRVLRLQAVADHRPERATRVVAALTQPAPGRPVPLQDAGATLTRPAWLLPQPVPLPPGPAPWAADRPWLDGRALRLVCGPERIESGWWDGEPVARDYFVACDEEGALLWVYRHRFAHAPQVEPAPTWYLHGRFG